MFWKLSVAHVAVRGSSIGAGNIYITLGETDEIAGTGLGNIGLLGALFGLYFVLLRIYFSTVVVLDLLLNCFA
jgi:hypothetical protein